MYVTKPLSLYRRSPEALHEEPPEGPGSGYLVIQDEEYELEASCCFGMCRDRYLSHLPFPQDRRLTAEYYHDKNAQLRSFYFIPVIDQPISSNRYYVVIGQGKHKGKMSTCSREADKTTCCFCRLVKDVKPREFDAKDIYQQLEILVPQTCAASGLFHAKSVSPDGFPETFLRTKSWAIRGSTKHVHPLSEASGIDDSLRACMANVSFSGASSSSSAIVGKWYCPFMFVREEDMSRKDQVEKNCYYEMTLEQFWEQIYDCVNYEGSRGKAVKVSTSIRTKRSSLHANGMQEMKVDDSLTVDGFKWFKPFARQGGGVGLSTVIVDRMKWEVERAGWVEEKGTVEKAEAGDGNIISNGWQRFRCYVLVERFALKRLDGTLLLTYDFKHTDKLTCRWD